jgi:hypothetical protein
MATCPIYSDLTVYFGKENLVMKSSDSFTNDCTQKGVRIFERLDYNCCDCFVPLLCFRYLKLCHDRKEFDELPPGPKVKLQHLLLTTDCSFTE